MDPNENLTEQLSLAQGLVDIDPDNMDTRVGFDLLSDAARLAELVIALDRWIRQGGFRPTAWGD